MAEKLYEQLQKELLDSGDESQSTIDLYNLLDEWKPGDDDLREYIHVNKASFDKNPILYKLSPIMNDLTTKVPKFDRSGEDYGKLFGDVKTEDLLDNLDSYSYRDIEAAANRGNKNPKDFVKELYDAKLQRDRYKIAHEGTAGTIATIFAPRVQKAAEEGRDPTKGEVFGDILENVGEATPVFGSAVVPTATEAYDYLVNDKDFHIGDVAVKTASNLVAPRAARRFGSLLFGNTAEKTAEQAAKKSGIIDKAKSATRNALTKAAETKPGKAVTTFGKDIEPGVETFVINKFGDISPRVGSQANNYIRMIPWGVGEYLVNDTELGEAEKNKTKAAKEKAENKYKGKLTRKQLLGEE